IRRTATGVLLAIILLAGAAFCAQPNAAQKSKSSARKHRVPVEETVSPAVIEAEIAMEKKDYATAERLLQEAVHAEPADYRAWFDLGFVLNAAERRLEAVEAYRRSIAARPDIFEANLNLGVLLAASADPEAATFLRAATRLKPSAKAEVGLARAWISLGRVLEERHPEQALAAYGEAATQQPLDPEPHLSVGSLLEKQGQLDAAEEEYRKAAELNPKSIEALSALINLFSRSQRLAEAEATLRRYLEVEPASSAARVQLGRLLVAQGRAEEGLALLKERLEANPEDVAAMRELAGLQLAAKHFEDAAKSYGLLVQKLPQDSELRHALGVAWMNLRKYPEAQQELLAAVNLKPDLAAAYGDLAVAAAENKNYGLALQALDARARYLPEDAATYYLRATSFDHLRAYKEAALHYRQFLAVAQGKFPDLEWKARHRLIALEGGKK
ncbi:MAG: tetratricopeptide repeat protein, partial [Terriglobales bacterium]